MFVSRQLGHANANVTLSVYRRREHGELARQALEASYAAMRRALWRTWEPSMSASRSSTPSAAASANG